jgi:hypothetical protein
MGVQRGKRLVPFYKGITIGPNWYGDIAQLKKALGITTTGKGR